MKFTQFHIQRLKETRDVKSLIEALGDSGSESIRVLAADALGDLKDVESVEALAEAALWDESEDVRSVAHDALVEVVGNQADTVLESYRKQPPKDRVKKDNEEFFNKNPLGNKSLDALIDILFDSKDRKLRILAAKALGDLGDEDGVEALAVAALWDKSEEVRTAAHAALVNLVGNQTEAVLESYRANPPEDIREPGSEDDQEDDAEEEDEEEENDWDEEGLRGLMMVLEGETNLELKLKAVQALGMIDDIRATQALARATFVDEEPRLQFAARKALENIFGEDAKGYIDSIWEMDLNELDEDEEEDDGRDEEDEGEWEEDEGESVEEDGGDSAEEIETDEAPAVTRPDPAQSVYNRLANQTPVVEWDDPRKRILLPLVIGLLILGVIIAAVFFLR